VHTNSGVGNKWFYLLSVGGTHHSVTVNGIGIENALAVAYRANVFYWTSSTDYHQAALGTISAAEDLDPSGDWASEAALAWNAVGVSTPGPGLVISYPLGTPDMLTPDLATTFDVEVSGTLGGSQVPGSGQLHYSIDGAAYDSVFMTQTGADSYEAELPALSCGSRINFFVSVEEASSGTFYDPDPSRPLSAISASGVSTVFSDDFESDQGWTVSGTATDGQWGRGVPIGGGDRGDPPSDFDGSGSCFLTDNVDGNSDVDGGVTSLTSPAFDLSAGDVRIHYERWYSNHTGDDPYNDIFEVYVSDDDGSSWQLVETVGPVDEADGGWYEHTFWVGDYVTPTSQVRVRFDASDLAAGSIVEAALDDFAIESFSCSAPELVIETSSFPEWTADFYFEEQLAGSGGVPPYTWADRDNDLVGSGLVLGANGLLSGTPNSAGALSFIAELTDASSNVVEKGLSVDVNGALLITTTALGEWTEGIAYSSTLSATGGTGGKVWQDMNGDLTGSGLSLSSTGDLTGTPNGAGDVAFTAEVFDQIGASDNAPLTLTVNPPVSISTDALPAGSLMVAYTQQLVSAGGTGADTWSDKNGSLAAIGLALSAAGELSGMPTTLGEHDFTAEVTDAVGSSAEKLLTIEILRPYVCGDANGNGDVAVPDAVLIINWIFKGGAAPVILEAADANCDGQSNIADATHIINWVFKGGPGPCCP
jgi:hypothetical protein